MNQSLQDTLIKKVEKELKYLVKNSDISDYEDIEIYSTLDKEYLGCILTLTSGGPNIYIDTRNGFIEGNWNGAKYKKKLSNEVINLIDDQADDLWNTNLIL